VAQEAFYQVVIQGLIANEGSIAMSIHSRTLSASNQIRFICGQKHCREGSERVIRLAQYSPSLFDGGTPSNYYSLDDNLTLILIVN